MGERWRSPTCDQLTFELEHFEWRGEDRLEVTGRWYGLRGQRFVRPTLHVREGSRRRRMIAVLDHKPWPPEADTPWIAAFTYRGERDAHHRRTARGRPRHRA